MVNVPIHLKLVTQMELNHADFQIVVITKKLLQMFATNNSLAVFLMVLNAQPKEIVQNIRLKLLANQVALMELQIKHNPVYLFKMQPTLLQQVPVPFSLNVQMQVQIK